MDWSLVREIVLRRHAIVHNGGLATREYVENVATGTRLGARLVPDRAYASRAIDELSVLALLVSVEFLSTYPIADRHTNNRVELEALDAMKTGRWRVGLYLSQRRIESHREAPWAVQHNVVNAWLARINMHGLDSCRREIEEWEPRIYGGVFMLAKACLLDQRDEALDLLVRLMEADLVSFDDLSTWPLFSALRKDVRLGLPDMDDLELASDSDLAPWLEALAVDAGPVWDEPEAST